MNTRTNEIEVPEDVIDALMARAKIIEAEITREQAREIAIDLFKKRVA